MCFSPDLLGSFSFATQSAGACLSASLVFAHTSVCRSSGMLASPMFLDILMFSWNLFNAN